MTCLYLQYPLLVNYFEKLQSWIRVKSVFPFKWLWRNSDPFKTFHWPFPYSSQSRTSPLKPHDWVDIAIATIRLLNPNGWWKVRPVTMSGFITWWRSLLINHVQCLLFLPNPFPDPQSQTFAPTCLKFYFQNSTPLLLLPIIVIILSTQIHYQLPESTTWTNL